MSVPGMPPGGIGAPEATRLVPAPRAAHTSESVDARDEDAFVERVDNRLRSIVGGLEPGLGAVCSYHVGRTDRTGRPTTAVPGKMLRARLVFAGAGAFGAPWESAIHAAAAVELVHNSLSCTTTSWTGATPGVGVPPRGWRCCMPRCARRPSSRRRDPP